jgi:DNA primase
VVEAYMDLKQRGDDFWGLCPFHKEKTPSFKVSRGHQSFYCFGCQKSGSVFHFIQEMENTDFVGAVRLLAQRCGVQIPETEAAGSRVQTDRREHLFALLRAAADWFHRKLLSDQGAGARAYLQERGVPEEAVDHFGLGYAPADWDQCLKWAGAQGWKPPLCVDSGLAIQRGDGPSSRCYDRFRDRLMFPIWDELGRVVGFSGRLLSSEAKEAKYINTPETDVFHKGRLLYALHLARQAFKENGCALVCEGQLDVIACHRAGLTHAVAPQGTAFTETQAQLLRRHTGTITFALDSDNAGIKAAVRGIEIAFSAGLKANAVILPEGSDPDSLFRTGGREAVREAVDTARPGFDVLVDLARKKHDDGTPEGENAVVQAVLASLMNMPDPTRRAAYAQSLAQKVGLPADAVLKSLARQENKARRRYAGPANEARTEAAKPPVFPRLRTDSLPGDDAVRTMLLDIALHHRELAEDLCHRLPHTEEAAPSPLTQALDMVMELTLEGAWDQAAQRLTEHPELLRHPLVSRALMESEFTATAEEEEKGREHTDRRVRRAMEDCLLHLERQILEREVARLQSQLAQTGDAQALRQALRDLQSLRRQLEQLRRPS